MSIQNIGLVNVTQGIIFTNNSGSLDGDGLLSIDFSSIDTSSEIVLPNGATLNGIALLDGTDPLYLDENQDLMLVVRSSGTATITHGSGAVDPEYSCVTSSGTNVVVDSKRIQIFYSYEGGGWRWRVPDWRSEAASVFFAPSNGADWVDADPGELASAVNRLATAVAGLLAGPIP